ncbi:MAG: Gfo/Idh/MocA family oxidoreductase [Planctomycetota bacterium]
MLGVGHLGKNHARCYHELPNVELVGVVDPSPENAKAVEEKLGVPTYPELTDELLDEVHAVSVVTPTPTHFEVAKRCMAAGVSTLVEKPMTSTLDEAHQLCAIAEEQGVTLQVGHIERFNPVVLAAVPHVVSPVFIECDRIHPFSFRSVETSVVLDLMIHDIDLVLQLVGAPAQRLDAAGARILSETEDLASTRLSFENGCVAMFKASRVAIRKSRKMRIFCEESYISLDYVARTGMKISMKDGFDRSKVDFREMAAREEETGTLPIFTEFLRIEQLDIADDEPLKSELASFADSVRSGRTPVVTGQHGLQAIEIATQIEDSIRKHHELYVEKRQD